MASVTRLSNSALKAGLRTPAFGKTVGYNTLRCYSAKTQVCAMPTPFADVIFF